MAIFDIVLFKGWLEASEVRVDQESLWVTTGNSQSEHPTML
jgi:hypothetical protein